MTATLAWAGFWAMGLPSYYQQYSRASMMWFDTLVFFPIVAVFYLVLRRVRLEARTTVSLWCALYFTVPLAFYDWLYCGVYLGHGLHFLGLYWYLTAYYAIPWIVLPLIALLLNRAHPTHAEKRASYAWRDD